MNKSAWLMILFTWFLGNLGIHFMTPALPALATLFHTTPRIAQLTISLFLLGKALSMLFWSGISERRGRKPVFIAGLGLYVVSNFLASWSPSMTVLLICRFLQGLAVGATLLMGRAMINDTHNEQQATQQFAFLFSLAGLLICFLPFLGGVINSFGNWRVASTIMAGYGLLLLIFSRIMPETMPYHASIPTLRSSISLVFRNTLFVRYLLVSALMMAGESAFNTSASFILIKGAGYSVSHYGAIKTIMAIMHMLGTAACGLLIRYFTSAHLVVLGVRLFAVSACAMWLFSLTHGNVLLTFIIPMTIYYFGTGFIVACTTAASVRPFPKQMATALALTLFCQFNFSASFSLISSMLNIQSVTPFMLLLTVISLLSVLAWPGTRLVNPRLSTT
ncbi:multidrug effflux MFS transporter [Legionella spiritensis]|uniref:Drug resistance transporter, Bcr/CflA n=1 Tax=Legionella spiritensis TaxID=452 RepID=A0A0W0Z7K4_LEGSP|nr:multidrug effflux MFS transporter [Legionella spiritensis]KTD64742.1 drug resistance transporter, Bcr/CflA [Legionella spiritensis]